MDEDHVLSLLNSCCCGDVVGWNALPIIVGKMLQCCSGDVVSSAGPIVVVVVGGGKVYCDGGIVSIVGPIAPPLMIVVGGM
ncbi:MAG: hypothetical protein GY740_00075 [Gammaproteobacteria bacterium]|nr:hypothetical protein [Gammaproteobacteria bacterium]